MVGITAPQHYGRRQTAALERESHEKIPWKKRGLWERKIIEEIDSVRLICSEFNQHLDEHGSGGGDHAYFSHMDSSTQVFPVQPVSA